MAKAMWIRTLAVCILTLSAAATTSAKEHYRIGTQDFDYSPQYNFTGRKDKGYAWAVFETFAEQNNISFEYVPLPLKRLQSELRKGNVDFVYPDNARWHENEEHHLHGMKFSRALTMAVYGTMVHRQRQEVGLDNFRSVAFPQGFVPTKWQKLYEQKKLQLIETSTAEIAIKMVLRGRADGADIEYSVTQYILDKIGRPGEVHMDEALPLTIVGFRLSSIQHKGLLEKFDTFLLENKALLDDLKAAYGLQETVLADRHHQGS